MDYGVKIQYGIEDWQILQQNDSAYASLKIGGTYRRIRQSFELPLEFSEEHKGKVKVQCRIAIEDTGESLIPWQDCEIKDDQHWEIFFPEIPAGGLYRIETYMEYEGWDGLSATRGDMVHHIGVGDVFVIAGQSNASGRAKNTIYDPPELGVHLLKPSGKWTLASHPLAETTDAVYLGHFENHNPGHSPWLHFAKLLKKSLGYPIALIPTAYGGAPLRWWNPKENGSLTENMIKILKDHNIKPKAVLWYQGEAEGFENSGATYLERFEEFVESCREALAQPELPFFTVQINACLENPDEKSDRQWGMVREAQRKAAHLIPAVYVVPSADLALYDSIHISAESNLVVAERVAAAALKELYQRGRDYEAPEPVKAMQIDESVIKLVFKPVRNWLNTFELPAEELPFDAEDEKGLCHPDRYQTGRDDILLHFPRALRGKVKLHGAWRMNPGKAIPSDCMRTAILSFYAFPVEKEQADPSE